MVASREECLLGERGISREPLRTSGREGAEWESFEKDGVVEETIFESEGIDSGECMRRGFWANSRLNLGAPSPLATFPEPPNKGLERVEASGDDFSSFTMNLLVLALGSSRMRGNLDPSPSLVGEIDLLLERVEFNLDASKWRGREDEGPEAFRLNRALGCEVVRSPSPLIPRDGQFRE